MRSVAAGIALRLSHLSIRNAGARDFDSVLRFWNAVDTPPGVSDTYDGLELLLARDPHALLLAESGNALIGTLIAAWDGWRGSFYRLAVHPTWRRAGVATGLVQHGERRLAQLGALRLTAIVIDSDPVAVEFWSAAGYEQQEHRARFVRHLSGA